MFKQRLVTAIVLGTLVVGGVLILPTAWFGGGLLLIVLRSAWEWSGLLGLSKSTGRIAYCSLVLIVVALASLLLAHQSLLWIVLLLVFAYWCYVLFWLWRYATNPQVQDSSLAWGLAGLVTLVAPWLTLLDLHRIATFGPGYVFFLMLLIWMADSGAYFAGRRWGHHKLALQISPGKTWEGAYGAMAVALVLSLAGAMALGLDRSRWFAFVVVCLITVAFSIVGDLFESMLKRQHGVKDSASVLPGHGGFLDRVDSLTAAAPIFFLGLLEIASPE